MATQEETFKKIVAHCKEYGFVFPSSEIYDGLGAVYDYGQNGVELKNNIKRYWCDLGANSGIWRFVKALLLNNCFISILLSHCAQSIFLRDLQ